MFEIIKDKIKDKKLIIFGELHGTKEIPKLISEFFLEIAKEDDFNVCLEIPSEFQEEISKFLISGDKNKLENISFFSNKYNRDGRNSAEYMNLIKTIYFINKTYKKNIQIFCVDPNANTQNKKERGIAENITKILDTEKTFAVLGDVHASKKRLSFGKTDILPAGFILFNKLSNKMFSIRILPKKGEFFNLGLKKVFNNKSQGSFNEGFDYILEIENVSPCSFLDK